MKNGEVTIPLDGVTLEGELLVPAGAGALVVFAHGSGSSRHSPRNQYVAGTLRAAGLGTLLFDLLTAEEEQAELRTRHLRFDIPFLAARLRAVTRWAQTGENCGDLRIGYFGASTGAAAALTAAAEPDLMIGAVVSRGGRPDLAEPVLNQVKAPTLLIVGGADTAVIALNELAYARLSCEKALRLVQRATHLFEEPGALEAVSRLAAEWFNRHLRINLR